MKRTLEPDQTEEERQRELIAAAPLMLAESVVECRVRFLRATVFGDAGDSAKFKDYVSYVPADENRDAKMTVRILDLFKCVMDETPLNPKGSVTRPLFLARPAWWPILPPTGDDGLTISWISLVEDQNVTRLGAGHAYISFIEQMVAGLYGKASCEFAAVDYCYFPTYFTLDGHYNWETIVIADKVPGTVGVDTVPLLLYPRYLSVFANQQPELANKKSEYKPVDVVWYPPQLWFPCRRQHYLTQLESSESVLATGLWSRCKLHPLYDFIAETLFHPIRSGNMSGLVGYEAEHGAFGPIRLRAGRLSTEALQRDIGSEATRKLLAHLTEHCVHLGNADVSCFHEAEHENNYPGMWAAFKNQWMHRNASDVRVVLLDRLDFDAERAVELAGSGLNQRIRHEERVALRAIAGQYVRLFLALLVDMCRVFYRPLVITRKVVRVLCDKLGLGDSEGNPNYLLGDSEDDRYEMPRPLPYFMSTDDDAALVYMPRRKPHTTDWATGTTYTPLPLTESVLLPEELVKQPRPQPVQGTIFSCAARCGAEATVTDGVFAFCSADCQSLYYRGGQ